MNKNNKQIFKEKLYEFLSNLYSNVEKEAKFHWCTSHSGLNVCDKIYQNIKSYRNADFLPERVTQLSCDYVIHEKHLVIEYDEFQHFTYQRQLSLEAYSDNITLHYNKEKWIQLCKKFRRKMNKKNDIYRDEKRAYYDSIRDIIIPCNGYKLVRIYHGQIDFNSLNAFDELIKIIS